MDIRLKNDIPRIIDQQTVQVQPHLMESASSRRSASGHIRLVSPIVCNGHGLFRLTDSDGDGDQVEGLHDMAAGGEHVPTVFCSPDEKALHLQLPFASDQRRMCQY